MPFKIKIAAALSLLYCLSYSQLHVKNQFAFAGKKDLDVKTFSQDYNGNLFLGTKEGVYIFDGKTTQAFAEDFAGLRTEISCVFIDESEKLWIATHSGKLYTYFKSKIDSVIYNTDNNATEITSIIQLKSSFIFGTYGNGLFLYKDNKTLHFNTDNGLPDNVIYNLIKDESDNIWCGTDAGIIKIEAFLSQVKFKLISNKNGLPDNIVRHISLYKNKLLISMQDSGICFLDIKKNEIEKINFSKNWQHGTVLQSAMQGDDKLLVATEKDGLFQIVNNEVYQYLYPEIIQSSRINKFFLDKNNQIWLGSKKGFSQLNEDRFNLINTTKGLSENKILALAADNANNLWIGTTMGISKIKNIEGGKIIETKIQELSKYTISCATKAPDGNIWFGTYGNGIVVMSTESEKNIVLNSKEDKIPNDNISNIYFSNDTTVYISTLGAGLLEAHVELKGKAKLFNITKVFTAKEGLPNEYVYSAISDNDGNLFVATDGGGLNEYKNHRFHNISKPFKLLSHTFFSLCCDKNNNIWSISNADGIIKYDGKKITTFNQKNGLRDVPQQMIALGNGLYLVNSIGIDRIDIETNEITYKDFFEKDIDPNLNAVCVLNNKIICGTNNGLLIYRTDKNAVDSVKPKVSINSLEVNFKNFPLDSIFEFGYKQNNFSIGFKGVWLKNPYKLTYRYRLNGLEENWIYCNEEKIITYNNLNAGNYTFLVQVKNDEEIWSEPEGFAFIIGAPIWKRWWFWPLAVLIIGSGIYFFLKYRLKALQKENEILEQKVAQRTEEIESQSKIIAEKNKDILDSIAYARKIQQAILPNITEIKSHLPNSFIVYMTKDIVSGDFYFFTHIKDESIIAAIDCTGHGVPGAFMSLIGYNLLHQIINEKNILEPHQILLKLNKGVLNVLHKNETESKDGMDAAICKINHTTKTLSYAGAMRPLWMVKNNELTEIKADKIPIGTKQSDREDEIKYTLQTFELNDQTSFYIFTDGFGDQFGGEKGKKFSTGKFKDLIISNSQFDFDTQLQNIRQAHLDWKGTSEQVDDICVIGFRV